MTLTKVLNFFRRQVKRNPISDNTIRKLMQATMREKIDEDWTYSEHLKDTYKKKGEVWNPAHLTFAGSKAHCKDFPNHACHGGAPIDDIEFVSMASGLVVFPDKACGDGGDLTRCVKISVANRRWGFRYPRDFAFLTTISGGPRPVEPKHLDANNISRWEPRNLTDRPTQQQINSAFDLQQYVFKFRKRLQAIDYLQQFAVVNQPAVPVNSAGRRPPRTLAPVLRSSRFLLV
jgi:hypothetical protein